MHDLDKYCAFASTLSSRREELASRSAGTGTGHRAPKDTFVILKYFVDFGRKIFPSQATMIEAGAKRSLWGIWGFHLTKSRSKNPTHSFLITPTDTLIVLLVPSCMRVSVWSKSPIHCSTAARAGEIGLTWRMSDLILNYGFWFLHSLLRSPLSLIDLRMSGDWRPN